MSQVQCFTFGPFQENTYVLYDGSKECVIIDPGCYSAREEQILLSWINDNKLVPKHLINTHAHIDHILGNAFVCKTFSLKPMLHAKELVILQEMSPRAAIMYGMNYTPSPDPEAFIEEGDVISFGQSQLNVLFTPGHAPGHVVLVNKNDGYVVNGDVLFQGSVGRTDLPYCNYNDLENSILTKLYTLPDNYVVYTGHGNPTKIGIEKRTNPFVSI